MEFHNRPVRQIAFYTEDVEAAALRHSAAFGSGPFLIQQASCKATDRGRDIEFASNFCVGQWGDVMVEFVAPTSVPTVMSELALEGRLQRFHHVALVVEDFDLEIERLGALGYPLVHLGSPVAMPEFRFAFVDALSDLGMFIELYPAEMVEQAYTDLRQLSIGWDGSEPLRRVDPM